MKRVLPSLVLLGFVILFLENGLIRWLPSHVRALAYFKNLVLLSTFLGLGLGALLAERARALSAAFAPLLLAELGLALWLGRFVITGEAGGDEHLWLLYYDLPRGAPTFPLWAALALFFALNAAVFVPLGQRLGALLSAARSPVVGYACDLVGSIAGTLAFVGLSFAELGPHAWFVPALALGALLEWPRRARAGLLLLAAVAVALLPIDEGRIWSPYYALSHRPIAPKGEGAARVEAPGHYLAVNGSYHQSALDLSVASAAKVEKLARLQRAYAAPYERLAKATGLHPLDVLIVGAGTGNDVAVALERGARRIDAVEIDPVILRLGRELHPNRPYADPRVRAHATDARGFLQRATGPYDLVVFGTLDSETQLSALSTIRLDNFVYTVESLRRVRALLRPGGALVLYFWADKPWLRARIARTVEDGFGHAPLTIHEPFEGLFNFVVIAPRDPTPALAPTARPPGTEAIEPATDDWPYLYQRERGVSPFYAALIAAFALFSTVAIWLATRAARSHGAPALRVDVPMMLQGAAFMLLETAAIATLSLLFGSTWLVNAFVFGVILVLLLGASLYTRWRGAPRFALIGALLTAALTAAYFVPVDALLGLPMAARLAAAAAVTLSPIFFSSLLFAGLLDRAREPAAAYGSNLLGAVLGGLAEWSAAATGFRALFLVALALYLGALLVERKRAA